MMRGFTACKKAAVCIGAFALTLSMLPLSGLNKKVYAEDEYTYTVRVFGGNIGDVTGGTPIDGGVAFTGIKDGEKPSGTVSVEIKNNNDYPDKYFAKGVRLAGRDNYDGLRNLNYISETPVHEDTDYVVAYGVKNSAVEYRVVYYSNTGEKLLEDETHYASDKDNVIVHARHIPGYFPQANNIGKEIVAGKENLFTFVYRRNETTVTETQTINEGTTVTGTTGTYTVPGTNTNTGTAAGTAGTTGTTGSGTNAGTGANFGVSGTGLNSGTGTNAGTPAGNANTDFGSAAGAATGNAAIDAEIARVNQNGPRSEAEVPDIINIDENNVPLAEFEGSSSSSSSSSSSKADSKSDSKADKSKSDESTSVSSASSAASSSSAVNELDTPTDGLSTMKKVGIGAGIAAAVGAVLGGFFLLRRRYEEDDEDDDE